MFDRKYHFIYKTICNVTGQFYIGLHSTDNIDDGYLGSGILLKDSVRKYGKDNHARFILEFCDSRENLLLKEASIITNDIRKDKMSMNISVGGRGNSSFYGLENIKGQSRLKYSKLKIQLDTDVKNMYLSRDQILKIAITKDGHLNKNFTRNLQNVAKPAFAGLNKNALLREAKWKFIREAIQNPVFGDNPQELIYAYLHKLTCRPRCKTCDAEVTFGRFKSPTPYKTYCDAKCQLMDRSFENPVFSRWKSSTNTSASLNIAS